MLRQPQHRYPYSVCSWLEIAFIHEDKEQLFQEPKHHFSKKCDCDDIDMYRDFYGDLFIKGHRYLKRKAFFRVDLASVDLSLNTSFSMGVYESRED